MDKMKQVAKGGWHPDGERKRTPSKSQQNDEWSDSKLKNFKGLQQVAGWTGYKPPKGPESHSNVSSRPLTSLKDPASFGAPPRRDPKAPLPPPKPRVDTSEPALPERPAIPPRGLASPAVPPRTPTWGSSSTSGTTSPSKPKPQLPPRASASSRTTTTASPAASASRTQSFPSDPGYGQSEATIAAASRLGGSGISVPGFNIGRAAARKLQGRDTKTGQPLTTTTTTPPPLPPPTRTTTQPSPPPKPSPGFNANTARETLSQSQTAFKPFSSYQQGKPVSLGEVKSAASAASSIREKHGDQIAQGYRMAEKANLVQTPGNNNSDNHGGGGSSSSGSGIGVGAGGFGRGVTSGSSMISDGKSALQSKIANKKPPPPVPNRKPQLQTPPAIPLDSKPK